ncbi:MAG: permease-like cell division protein FtsX [Pseudomonadota bacterium]|nr:permease-like cell division protein FtsX [Pseudomonadota bacterium]MDP1572663.1 permease-like cell division protein FtsX [Pseudomonadota bacterium]MDP1906536.1 permease-like cell division protein FtsX [Pseudomonadota bacterium]
MKAWLAHHLHSLKLAAEQFRAAPVATLFTILVIGVAVSLPAGLYVLLSNLERAAGSVKPQAEVTAFFKDVDETKARALAASLRKRADVAEVEFVSKADGIKRLEAAGLADVALGLPENPLPHTLAITPGEATPVALEALAAHVKDNPDIERVLVDTDWIKRLAALMQLGRDLVSMLIVVLGVALAAITANTIRLQIYAQKDEIEVARLIGATDRFIRRPFLYFGGIQGLVGGLAGWALVLAGGLMLETSVAQVAAAYGSQFRLVGLSLRETGLLLLFSALLGWLGAYFAVSRALRQND